jgi:hypothetical protein
MESFTEFSAQQAERVPGWKALVDAFEADPSAKNPYEMKVKGTSGNSSNFRRADNC